MVRYDMLQTLSSFVLTKCFLCFVFLQISFASRHAGEKQDISVDDISNIPLMLTEIQAAMFAKAKAGRDEKIATVMQWSDFVPALERDCLVLTPFCDQADWEDKVKVRLPHARLYSRR